MIDKDFNFGWGDVHTLRQFEQKVVFQYLDSWVKDDKHNIIVNSVWYGMDHHQVVKEYMESHPVDRVALVCFMDPAIVQASWFKEYDVEVRSIGYYRTPDEIDAWALIHDQFFKRPDSVGGAETIDTPFLCYNRKPHWHRKRFFNQLTQLNLVNRGVVSMGFDPGPDPQPAVTPLRHALMMVEPDEPVHPVIAPNMDPEVTGIVNDILTVGSMQVWNRCFLNIITETIFDVDAQWFVSEKIYKPVQGLRPFIVHAPNGAEDWLKHVGLEHFLDDFKDISDLDLRDPTNHSHFLLELANQPIGYYQDKYCKLENKILHNRAQFDRHIEQVKHKVAQGIQ